MKRLLIVVPIALILIGLYITSALLYTYKQAYFGELHGAGAAQWQMQFFFAYFPVITNIAALLWSFFFHRKDFKTIAIICVIASAIPITLFMLVANGIY
jgi:RsiW-degrading membrane proteinase PrsW (M82 family)